MFTGNMSQKEVSYNMSYLRLLGHVILQISILHVHRNMSQKENPYDVPFLRLLGHVILKKYQRRVSATPPCLPRLSARQQVEITALGKAGSEVCELSSIT
jgi:hypothetical protein